MCSECSLLSGEGTLCFVCTPKLYIRTEENKTSFGLNVFPVQPFERRGEALLCWPRGVSEKRHQFSIQNLSVKTQGTVLNELKNQDLVPVTKFSMCSLLSGAGTLCFVCPKVQRGASLIRNTHPPKITIGPLASGYCRVLWGGEFL